MLPVINSSRFFSISELETLSTIKAHTFRMWEKRFSLVQPKRSFTNLRNYSLSELRYLLNISLLRQCGFKISCIAGMDLVEMDQKISQLSEQCDLQCRNINDLIIAMYNLDADTVEQVLNESIERWGMDAAITAVIFPFMERVQLFFLQGSGAGNTFCGYCHQEETNACH